MPDRSARKLADSVCAVVRALARQAEERPIEPSVFFQEGIDWRWIDWRSLATRVARLCQRLDERQTAGCGLEGLEVGYLSTPALETLVLDLAIRHAGAVPRPQGSDTPARASRNLAWIADAGDAVLEGEAAASRPELARGWRRARAIEVAAIAAGSATPLTGRRGPSSWLRRSAPREVVADVLELERPLCRAGVSWVLERGGTLVLAHERGSLEATARWARPTRLWAETTDARFERLVEAVLGHRRRAGVRLVSALWSGEREPAAATFAALASRGVACVEWRPACTPGGTGC